MINDNKAAIVIAILIVLIFFPEFFDSVDIIFSLIF
jgi:hypothetical protein